jgi:hypothetical protein
MFSTDTQKTFVCVMGTPSFLLTYVSYFEKIKVGL